MKQIQLWLARVSLGGYWMVVTACISSFALTFFVLQLMPQVLTVMTQAEFVISKPDVVSWYSQILGLFFWFNNGFMGMRLFLEFNLWVVFLIAKEFWLKSNGIAFFINALTIILVIGFLMLSSLIAVLQLPELLFHVQNQIKK